MDYQSFTRQILVNACGNNNDTPLDIAIRMKRWDIAMTLLKSGADPTIGNNNAEEYLHAIVADNEIDLFKLLLTRGCNPNAYCPSGKPVLDIAIDLKHSEIALMLLQCGADPLKGRSSLFKFVLCVESKSLLAVEKFLESSLIPHLTKCDWNIVLDFATVNLEEENAEQCCKLLIRYVNLKHEDWRKPSCLEDTEMSEFWDECKSDLLQMKKHDLGHGVTVRFFIQKKTGDQLAALIRRSGFAQSPKEFRHEMNALYYAYNELIMAKVREGVVRYYWLNLFVTVMRHSDLKIMSSELVWELSKYLCNDDIKQVVLCSREQLRSEDPR